MMVFALTKTLSLCFIRINEVFNFLTVDQGTGLEQTATKETVGWNIFSLTDRPVACAP
jgi:hypothetical protein